MKYAFINGEFYLREEAKISLLDRGLLFGDGIYTTVLVEDGAICFLEEHLTRLKQQCENLNIIPPDIEKHHIEEFLIKNDALVGTWRLKFFITGGSSPIQALPQRKFEHLFFTLDPFIPPPYNSLTVSLYPNPLMLPHANCKSLSSLHRYYVSEFAKQKGTDDAITMTESEILLEASFANLFWIYKNTFYTPDPTLPLYSGVTLKKMIKIASIFELDVCYARVRFHEIPETAHIYRVNTLRGLRPILKIEEKYFPRDLSLEHDFLSAYSSIKEEEAHKCASLSLQI